MRNRREWIFGSLATFVSAAALGVAGKTGTGTAPLDVTYYFLPG